MIHTEKPMPQVGSKSKQTQTWYSVQAAFLTNLVHNQTPVAIYLTTGIKLQGCIKGFDEYSLILANATTQVVYKHAISTVLPASVKVKQAHALFSLEKPA